MSVTEQYRVSARSFSLTRWSLAYLAIALAMVPPLLLLQRTLPVGPMYWDLLVYFDAANRIFTGQAPVVDFFVPVGPLGYYLFAGGLKLFPDAQPLLLASWSMLAVTAPLMALVLWDVEPRQGRGVAFALLVPFVVFALLPFNTREYFPYPGSDGFGIYNRQVCQILYVLVGALVFMPNRRPLAVVVTLAMTALFLTKITGFLAGFLVCLFAFAAGRMAFRYAAAAALAFFAILGGLEAWNGLVSQYARDILSLLNENAGTLLPRFLYAGAHTFGIAAPAGILVLVLLWSTRRRIGRLWRDLRRAPSWEKFTALVDHEALWLGVVLLAGIFFETQNTGSQALIFLWPVLLSIVRSRLPLARSAPRIFAAIALLAAAAALPPFVHTLHRATQTYVSALLNEPLPNENLKTIGSVDARPELIAHAEKLLELYARHRDTYRDFVEADMYPAFMFYVEYGFQLAHLMAIDQAITKILRLEEQKDIYFKTVMELNFVNPFPYLMEREAPKHIAIGADPTRAVPEPESEEEKAVRNTDLVLYPTCPLTVDNQALYELYAPALKDHFKISLSPCFDAYVHPRFAGKLG